MATRSPGGGEWQWEGAAAGAAAGFATVATLHPLDVVRTRFQVSDGRTVSPSFPLYRHTGHAIYTIARSEGLRGLYAGFHPAVLGSTLSWGLYFFFYNRAKDRYHRLRGRDKPLAPALHLVSAAEAGSLVCFCTNPIWLVKTRMQLQTSVNQGRQYTGFSDALRTILKEEGPRALFKGIGPALLLVSHGAIQFTFYEELRKFVAQLKKGGGTSFQTSDQDILNSVDYATLGACSKLLAIMMTYPCQVIRARVQQRPSRDGTPKYPNSWHAIKETTKFEGIRGFYRGITPNLLKNIPASSITFVVYENVLAFLKSTGRKG